MTKLKNLAHAAAFGLGAAVTRLPGLAAFACTVAGVYLLTSVAWALLAAVPFLLLLDRRAP